MTITTVMDPAAGGEEVSMEQDIGGVIKNTKGDNEISEDIGQLLPTEVSSAESDNFEDGDGEGNDFDQENENLADEITEEDIRRSRNNNNDNYEGKDNFEAAGYQDRQPLSVIDNKKNNNTITNAPVGESCNNDKTEIDTKAQSQAQAQSQGNKEEDDDNGDADSNTSTTTSTAPSTSSTTSTSFRGRPSSCVFVASLAASLSDDELCISVTESFRQYGQLARVKVLRDPANRPYAFVQYTNDRDAKRALKMARGSMLNGRTLRCESARVNRTLFVTHVVNPVFYLEVANLCGKFGELEQLVPSSDQNQFGRRYNYPPSNNYSWFVQFAYRDDAIRAFANLRTNSDWDVEWVQNIEVPKYYNLAHKMKKQQQQQQQQQRQNNTTTTNATSNSANDSTSRDKSISNENEFGEESEFGDNRDSFSSNTVGSNDDRIFIDKKSIFVGQLDQSVTREKLLERFSTHGEISDLNLINKTNKVFAFIQFETEEAAAAALERENHAIFLNKTMHVQYKEVGGHRSKRNFRRDNFYGNIRNIGPGFIHNNNHNNGNNSNNNNNNNNVGSIGSSAGGGNASTMGTNTIIPATSAAVAASIAASTAGHGNHTGGHGRMFTGPQVNLAPPPINMYKRRTQENDMPNMVPPFMAQQMPNPASEFDMNYVPYMNPGFRRKSSFINNGWSSSRSHSMKSDMDTVCGDGGTDATSDAPSESCGQMNSPTTCNDSSAGSMGHYDNNSSSNHGSDNSNNDSNNNNNNNTNTNDNNNNINDNNNGLNANSNNGHHNDYHNYNIGNGKRKYGKRGNNHRYHDTPKPYYFQPFYYHPMHYPIGPLGPVAPAHPSQAAAAAAAAAAAGNHPYMMIYPMPPPPPTGVEGNLLAQPAPLGPPGPMMRGSPPTSQSQGARSDVNEFVPNAKSCQLDY